MANQIPLENNEEFHKYDSDMKINDKEVCNRETEKWKGDGEFNEKKWKSCFGIKGEIIWC